jgi:hypothetical protein
VIEQVVEFGAELQLHPFLRKKDVLEQGRVLVVGSGLTGNMHSPRAQHTATLLSNGKVLLLGSSETASAELFDPASGLFTTTGSLVQARSHHTATLLSNGKVLVLGGTRIKVPEGGGAPAAPVSLGSAEIYEPAEGVFRTGGELLIACDSHSATLLANGTVLVAGGYSHGFRTL